jgi:elongation factor 1 alpha-like protein
MSRHRIKNIDFVDDDYGEGDEEDEYEDDNMVSPEDHEQMRLSMVEARKLLDSEIPPVPASDQEICEALWHYYYDVEKSVGYLRSVYSPSIP